MTRPRWPSATPSLQQWQRASQVLSRPRRAPGSRPGAAAAAASPKNPSPHREWPLLKRREPSPSSASLPQDNDETTDSIAHELRRLERSADAYPAPGTKSGAGAPREPVDWDANAQLASSIREDMARQRDGSHKRQRSIRSAVKDSSPEQKAGRLDGTVVTRSMLRINGLSTNLTAADFYRLAPNSLSDWENTIKKVQQKRHPSIFKPLGTYLVSFKDGHVAASYKANLLRLQRLANHRVFSPTGLWEATAPRHLLGADGADPAADLDALTITSPSTPDLSIDSRRMIPTSWADKLSSIVEPLGYGAQPSVLRVEVYPPGLSAADLAHFIKQDGWQRDLAWKVSDPVVVPLESDAKKSKRPPKMRQGTIREFPSGQFIIACETEWEARRFHRSWNQRTVTRAEDGRTVYRHVMSVSLIQW